MKIIFYILPILEMFISCKTKTKSLVDEKKYFYIRYGRDYIERGGDTTKIRFEEVNNGYYYTLTYKFPESVSIYNISKDSLFHQTYSRIKSENNIISFLGDTIIQIENRTDTIYKYILNEHIIDGGSIHYWSRKHGIFLVHSTNWPTLIMLQTNDRVENKKILQMIKEVYPMQDDHFKVEFEALMKRV